MAEVVVAELADLLHLPVPRHRVVTLAPAQATDDRNDELADLLAASVGENLGFRYLPSARALQEEDLERVPLDFAAQVRWLDWLTMNPDRGPANPNILVDGTRFWLIDHGAALPFQHDWAAVTEAGPVRPSTPLPHIFDRLATDLRGWDPLLTAIVTRATLAEAVALIPESFLRPLLPAPATTEAMERRRSGYAAYLWKRLRGPRPFAEGAAGHAG